MKMTQQIFPALLIPALVLFIGIAFGQARQEETPPLKRAVKAQKERTPAKPAAHADYGFGKTESLSGELSMVDAAANLAVVISANGVPFNFQVTPKTRIELGRKEATLASLAGQIHKDVLVEFTPQRSGNVARSIKVAGE